MTIVARQRSRPSIPGRLSSPSGDFISIGDLDCRTDAKGVGFCKPSRSASSISGLEEGSCVSLKTGKWHAPGLPLHNVSAQIHGHQKDELGQMWAFVGPHRVVVPACVGSVPTEQERRNIQTISVGAVMQRKYNQVPTYTETVTARPLVPTDCCIVEEGEPGTTEYRLVVKCASDPYNWDGLQVEGFCINTQEGRMCAVEFVDERGEEIVLEVPVCPMAVVGKPAMLTKKKCCDNCNHGKPCCGKAKPMMNPSRRQVNFYEVKNARYSVNQNTKSRLSVRKSVPRAANPTIKNRIHKFFFGY